MVQPFHTAYWIPVCTGMTRGSLPHSIIPVQAGIQELPAPRYLPNTGFLPWDGHDSTILTAEPDEPLRRDNKEEIMLPAESIIYALQRNWDMVDSALEGLDEADMVRQPSDQCNSAAWIL